MYSTRFIYGYKDARHVVKDLSYTVREETCCRHYRGYSFPLPAKDLFIGNSLWYSSCGILARMNEWMNECLTTPQHEKQIGYWASEKGKCMTARMRNNDSTTRDQSDDPLHHEQMLYQRATSGSLVSVMSVPCSNLSKVSKIGTASVIHQWQIWEINKTFIDLFYRTQTIPLLLQTSDAQFKLTTTCDITSVIWRRLEFSSEGRAHFLRC